MTTETREAPAVELPPAPPPARGPLKAWFWERLTPRGREVRAARQLAAQVRKALNRKGSEAEKQVRAVAEHMAQGMVARWMDDRGMLRCFRCLSTTQLRKLGGVYLCPVHRGEPAGKSR